MRLSHALVLPVLPVLLIVLMCHTAQAQDDQPASRPSPTTLPVPTTLLSPTTLPALQILDRMLQSRPDAGRPLSPGDAPPATEQPFVRKEGDLLRLRVGRLVRSQDPNAWYFNYEADGKTLQDPPMEILPNTNLSAMEATLKKSNRDVRFRITGVTTLYNGHNYILIEHAVVIPD